MIKEVSGIKYRIKFYGDKNRSRLSKKKRHFRSGDAETGDNRSPPYFSHSIILIIETYVHKRIFPTNAAILSSLIHLFPSPFDQQGKVFTIPRANSTGHESPNYSRSRRKFSRTFPIPLPFHRCMSLSLSTHGIGK